MQGVSPLVGHRVREIHFYNQVPLGMFLWVGVLLVSLTFSTNDSILQFLLMCQDATGGSALTTCTPDGWNLRPFIPADL